MEQLHALALACGLVREWIDVEGRRQVVDDTALAAVLAALGHEVEREGQIRRALAPLEERRAALPPMLVGDCGGSLALPFAPTQPPISVKTNPLFPTGSPNGTISRGIFRPCSGPATMATHVFGGVFRFARGKGPHLPAD